MSISRRRLLAAGATAGVALAAGAAGKPAHAADGAINWWLTANGVPCKLAFYKIANGTDPGLVGSGIVNSFMDLNGNRGWEPALAFYYHWAFSGVIRFIRLLDRDGNGFQIYRTAGETNAGPKGTFHQFDWDGTRYVRSGPYHWEVTGGFHTNRKPHSGILPSATASQSWHDHPSDLWAYPANVNGPFYPVHRYIHPNGEAHFWGRAFHETMVGVTLRDSIRLNDPDVGEDLHVKSPYLFVRPLDDSFNLIQVYWGDMFTVFSGDTNRHWTWAEGSALHIDTTQAGVPQTLFSWKFPGREISWPY